MSLSVFDVFKIGIGPSSSHTLGPMVIARRFLEENRDYLPLSSRVEVDLFGSLALTGRGHATDRAVILGLMGERAETLNAGMVADKLNHLQTSGMVSLLGEHVISFNAGTDIRFEPKSDLPRPDQHANGMRLSLFGGENETLTRQVYYSVGGGFVCSEAEFNAPLDGQPGRQTLMPFAFSSADELLEICKRESLTIAEIMLRNEDALRQREDTETKLDAIWAVMLACIERGLTTKGILPGGLDVKRRAPELWLELKKHPQNAAEALFDWLNVYAMAVNEENASGNQVVTAPTNGAAGIIPSVIKHYCTDGFTTNTHQVRVFLLTAAGIGMLFKQNASISGAEMGCQGEVGVACSMAAAGLAAVWGGEPWQVERAAEIGMEHNLGLTCDPVGGLVQIPCIERNAIGAVKAVNAARLALRSGEDSKVSLDQVIETMRQTGVDMNNKYKETSQGGLAVNVVEC